MTDEEKQIVEKYAKAVEKYAEVPLKFAYYYKYSFTFKGVADDGAIITTSYGGCSDDIYRYDVSLDTEKTLTEYPEDVWMSATVVLDGETLLDGYWY